MEHAALVFSKAQFRYFVEWSVATEDPLKIDCWFPKMHFALCIEEFFCLCIGLSISNFFFAACLGTFAHLQN
jgi:hypothetical protein